MATKTRSLPISIHEAGHIVLCSILTIRINKAVIQQSPDGEWSGYVRHNAGSVAANVKIGLAGQVSQQRKFPDPDSLRACSDFMNAYIALAGDLNLLETYKQEVEILLNQYWDKVVSVAEALMDANILNANDIEDVLTGKPSLEC